jgi:hypothetical protein
MHLPEALQAAAAGCLALAVCAPLADGMLVWEACGNLLFATIVAGVLFTHGLYTGGVAATAFRLSHRALRRGALGATSAAAAAMGACFVMAAASGGHVLLEYHYFLPLRYMLTVALAAFAFANYVPLVAAMEVWYTGVTICGFSRDDAPRGHARQPSALALLLGAMACATLGGGLCATATGVIELRGGAFINATSPLPEVHIGDAEVCGLYFGVTGKDERGAAVLEPSFDAALPSTQLELLAVCKLLLSPDAPTHSATHAGPLPCFMTDLQDWAGRKGRAFPIRPSNFDESVEALLREKPSLRRYVGLAKGEAHGSGRPRHVAWLRQTDLRAKHAYKGEDALRLVADPLLLFRYRSEWQAWIAHLPEAVRQPKRGGGDGGERPLWEEGVRGGSQPATDYSLPPPAESVLAHGISRCAKWSALETVLAFFSSVFTALCVTPVCSMLAIALFSRSLIISYLSLYTLLAMIVALLGTMRLIGLPLGVAGALALSLVIGISVDYLIHLAHAYKNSLFADRFYKSRAAIFARSSSIVSAACTTLLALAPLLFSHLLPLREFARIFTLVTIISFIFAVVFLVALMWAGPLQTRAVGFQKASTHDDHEGALGEPPPLTEPHSEGHGWALQLRFGEPRGPRAPSPGGGARPGVPQANDDDDDHHHHQYKGRSLGQSGHHPGAGSGSGWSDRAGDLSDDEML